MKHPKPHLGIRQPQKKEPLGEEQQHVDLLLQLRETFGGQPLQDQDGKKYSMLSYQHPSPEKENAGSREWGTFYQGCLKREA